MRYSLIFIVLTLMITLPACSRLGYNPRTGEVGPVIRLSSERSGPVFDTRTGRIGYSIDVSAPTVNRTNVYPSEVMSRRGWIKNQEDPEVRAPKIPGARVTEGRIERKSSRTERIVRDREEPQKEEAPKKEP